MLVELEESKSEVQMEIAFDSFEWLGFANGVLDRDHSSQIDKI